MMIFILKKRQNYKRRNKWQDPLRSIQIGHTESFSFYETICMQDVLGVQKESFSLQSYLL